jgi:fatty-acyl-CoA synthase
MNDERINDMNVYECIGDLLKLDPSGFWYFIDRIGDTFRWKGENVSTTEVAEAISTYPGVEEVNVYGVEVPHHDGRACCAAMVLGDNIDFKGLYSTCAKNLPPYAVPLFIRKLPKIDITGTFKHQKVELRNQGINPSKCISDSKQDQLFVYVTLFVPYAIQIIYLYVCVM